MFTIKTPILYYKLYENYIRMSAYSNVFTSKLNNKVSQNAMNKIIFQKRIKYQGDLKPLLKIVCNEYKIGNYINHEVITVGYEDLNISLQTQKGRYLAKLFASFRSKADSMRYIKIMHTAIEAGVQHPKIYKSQQGYLYSFVIANSKIHLCVLDFIEGETLHTIQEKISLEDAKQLAIQAAKINNISLSPPHIYDSWAVVNLINEYRIKKQYLSPHEQSIIEPILDDFKKIDIKQLPHCFVHGDLIQTNIMKEKTGKIYILDFSVANVYPRIQELAVILADLLYSFNNYMDYLRYYNIILTEYQKYIRLTEKELTVLPIYIVATHIMHILGPNYDIEKNNNLSQENKFWLQQGRKGLVAWTKQFSTAL